MSIHFSLIQFSHLFGTDILEDLTEDTVAAGSIVSAGSSLRYNSQLGEVRFNPTSGMGPRLSDVYYSSYCFKKPRPRPKPLFEGVGKRSLLVLL